MFSFGICGSATLAVAEENFGLAALKQDENGLKKRHISTPVCQVNKSADIQLTGNVFVQM